LTKLVDLSQDIFQGMLVWQGHLKTVIFTHVSHDETKSQFPNGMSYEARDILMSEHAGSHVDALFEIDPNGAKLDKMPLEWFYGEAICLDLSNIAPKTFITISDLKMALEQSGQSIKKGDIVLLHTGHYARTRGTAKYLTDYPGLDYDATKWLAESGVVNIGVDSPSPDNAIDNGLSSHRAVKDTGTLTITEHLANLEKVINKRFKYFGLPLKIKDATGSPIRAVAFVD
jgi:kynurenine formamidase